MEISLAGRSMIGSPMARSAWAKIGRVLVARHIARIEMHLRHAHVVAGDEAVENFGEEHALLVGRACP